MPAVINEATQYLSTAGKPLVGGRIYIGEVNADPVANPQTIYSDRALSVVLANPQVIDATGRASNKIWVSGRYSIQVNDINGVQVFQDLDAGDLDTVGNLVENIIGGNTITGTSDGVFEYINGQSYRFTAAQGSTGDVTLNINGIGARPVVKNNRYELPPGEILAGDVVNLTYNEARDVFSITNPNVTQVQSRSVSSDSTVTSRDHGNLIEVTSDATLAIAPVSNLRPGFVFKVKGRGARAIVNPDGATLIDGRTVLVVNDGYTAEVTYNGSTFETVLSAPVAQRGHLIGLDISNNAAEATRNIDFAPGECASDDARLSDVDLMVLGATITKSIDAAWVEGSGNGGLDAGSLTFGWYHCFIISSSTTGNIDALFSLSAENPTLPVGYDKKRRIGSIRNAGIPASIVGFHQSGDVFTLNSRTNDIDITTTNDNAATVVVTTPLGVVTEWRGAVSILDSSSNNNRRAVVYPTASTVTPGLTMQNAQVAMRGNADAATDSSEVNVMTDTQSQVRYRCSNGTDFSMTTLGWRDQRGRVT